MKTLSLQKRLAAKVMRVGVNKVWFDPDRIPEIKEAITKADIEVLIKEKAIKRKPTAGFKRRKGKIRQLRKKKGRGRGHGRKKKIIKSKKKKYMARIRNLRGYISLLKQRGTISNELSTKLRRLAKASIVRNKKDIDERLKQLIQ